MTFLIHFAKQRRMQAILLAALAVLAGASGCSTHAKRVALSRNLFYEGQLQPCREQLEKLYQHNRRDRDVANLDLAVVDLLQGNPKQAETRLKEVRDRFDYLEQDSLTEKTVSMWTDDSARSYAGEDYEKILIRVYLALANLMGDGIDAESYTLQIQEKHQQILARRGIEEAELARKRQAQPTVKDSDTPSEGEESKIAETGVSMPPVQLAKDVAPVPYRGLPIGFYLRGMLREQSHQNYDDALRSYSAAAALLGDCPPLQWDIARMQRSVHSQPGNGVIYVFAMVGRGPYKVESIAKPTSDALLIADRIVSAVGPFSVPPTIAPIKVPDVAVTLSDIESVAVSVDGQSIGPTASLADIEHLAVTTFQADRNRIVARAVARRVIKKATIVAVKGQVAKDSLTSIGMDLAGIAWEATEAADTRCWGLLPRDIQVLRVETRSGTHRLQLSPLMGAAFSGPPRTIEVPVIDGQNSYVLCWFPDATSDGQVLCSNRFRPAEAAIPAVERVGSRPAVIVR